MPQSFVVEDPTYVEAKTFSVTVFPPATTCTTYGPVESETKLTELLAGLSKTAFDPTGIDLKDHANELTTFAPEPVVSAEKYTFIPFATTLRPVDT